MSPTPFRWNCARTQTVSTPSWAELQSGGGTTKTSRNASTPCFVSQGAGAWNRHLASLCWAVFGQLQKLQRAKKLCLSLEFLQWELYIIIWFSIDFIWTLKHGCSAGEVCLPTSFVFTPGRRTPPVAAVAPVHPVAKPTEAEIQEQVRQLRDVTSRFFFHFPSVLKCFE